MKTSRKEGRESSETLKNSTANLLIKLSKPTKSPSTIVLIAKTSSPSNNKTKAASATFRSPSPTKSTKRRTSPQHLQQNHESSKNHPSNKTQTPTSGVNRRAPSEEPTITTQISTAALSTVKPESCPTANPSRKKVHLQSDPSAPINTCMNDPSILFLPSLYLNQSSPINN